LVSGDSLGKWQSYKHADRCGSSQDLAHKIPLSTLFGFSFLQPLKFCPLLHSRNVNTRLFASGHSGRTNFDGYHFAVLSVGLAVGGLPMPVPELPLRMAHPKACARRSAHQCVEEATPMVF
jgi:hypothetical protein